MSDMEQWAKMEIEIACAKERGNKDPNEWDYGVACYESALKAFEVEHLSDLQNPFLTD